MLLYSWIWLFLGEWVLEELNVFKACAGEKIAKWTHTQKKSTFTQCPCLFGSLWSVSRRARLCSCCNFCFADCLLGTDSALCASLQRHLIFVQTTWRSPLKIKGQLCKDFVSTIAEWIFKCLYLWWLNAILIFHFSRVLTLLLLPFKMILSEFDCFIEEKKQFVTKTKGAFQSEWFTSEMLSSTSDWCRYLPLTDCVSCPRRVYEHQKRTEACVIHPVHRLIMSLNKHVRQHAAGLRGKTIGHWPLSQIPTSVDEGLRDVLAPFDSPTVQKFSCSQQARSRGSNNPPSSRHSASVCSLKRNSASDLDVKSCHQCFAKHFKSHCHMLCERHPADL